MGLSETHIGEKVPQKLRWKLSRSRRRWNFFEKIKNFAEVFFVFVDFGSFEKNLHFHSVRTSKAHNYDLLFWINDGCFTEFFILAT